MKQTCECCGGLGYVLVEDDNGEPSTSGKPTLADVRGAARPIPQDGAKKKYYIASIADEVLASTSLTAADLAEQASMNSGTLSKVRSVGRWAHSIGTPTTASRNLREYWEHGGGRSQPISLDQACFDLMGDDEAAKLRAINILWEVFGATESFYHIAKGTRFHRRDARSKRSGR